jgi:hypothetical protein
MGTNYYVATNHCECCDRYDEDYHIGKSSFGWAFSFHGYRPELLVSWKQWKEFLKDKMIVDEYRKRIDYDWFVQFIEKEKSPNFVNESGRKNQLHNDAGRNDKYPWFNPDYDWDDEDGYSFSAREFS